MIVQKLNLKIYSHYPDTKTYSQADCYFFVDIPPVCSITWNYQHVHYRNISAILEEVFLIMESYAVAYPEAVVVQFHAASVAGSAVVGSGRLEW